MSFDPNHYGPRVAEILRLVDENDAPRAAALIRQSGASLFAGSRAPQAALAGLYLHAACWNEAHQTAQDIPTREGSYWHAIVHREEPDPGNSAYWFRLVGSHPIFPALAQAAGLPAWDPFRFIDQCEQARSQPGSDLDRQCRALRLAEWQLLFDWCACKNTASAPSSSA